MAAFFDTYIWVAVILAVQESLNIVNFQIFTGM